MSARTAALCCRDMKEEEEEEERRGGRGGEGRGDVGKERGGER